MIEMKIWENKCEDVYFIVKVQLIKKKKKWCKCKKNDDTMKDHCVYD